MSAGGEGAKSFFSSRARMKRSMSFLGQAVFLTCGNRRPHRRREGPMRFVFGPFGNPAPKQFLLGGGQLLFRFRRRHPLVGVGRKNAPHQLALVRLPGNDRRLAAVAPLSAAPAHRAAASLRGARHRGRGRQSTCRPTAAGFAAENRPCRPRFRQRNKSIEAAIAMAGS